MQTTKKSEKLQIKVEIRPGAKDALEAICKQEGMLQVEVISRLLEWFLRQDETVRAIALGHAKKRHIVRAMLQAEINERGANADVAAQLGELADEDLGGLPGNAKEKREAS